MSTPWDDGLTWYRSITATPEDRPLAIGFLREHWLRSPNGSVEDPVVDLVLSAALRACEHYTGRLIGAHTATLTLDAFPDGAIRLPYPPVTDVPSIAYTDEDGVAQTLTGSPAEFTLIAPTGPTAGLARLEPLYGESWPATRAQGDAVVVTISCGYDVEDTPKDLLAGVLLMAGELYKQRSLSVQQPNNTPALITAERCWLPYRVRYAV